MSERLYKNIWMLGVAALMIFTPLARGAVKLWSLTPVFLAIYFLLFLWFWKLTDSGNVVRVFKTSIVDWLILAFLFLAAPDVPVTATIVVPAVASNPPIWPSATARP